MSNSATVQVNSFLLFGKKKKLIPQTGSVQEEPVESKPKKLVGLKIARYEVAEEKVKFSNPKGLFKKRWVVEKEYPIYEIGNVETQSNWLSLTWNNQVHQFKLKRKDETFTNLYEQIQTMQTEHQKAKELNERVVQRKIDLLQLLEKSLPIVDSSFDILIGLNVKRVDWRQIEAYTQALGVSFNIKPITLPPLDLTFLAVDSAVKTQVAKDTSKEVLTLLKEMHSYFTGLKPEDDLANFNPNFAHANATLLAYYTLNDLMLAKVVGEKDSKKEVAYLEEMLKQLEGTSVQFDLEALLGTVEKVVVEAERCNAVFEVREIFREQLKQL